MTGGGIATQGVIHTIGGRLGALPSSETGAGHSAARPLLGVLPGHGYVDVHGHPAA
jgi:hypothetical protein